MSNVIVLPEISNELEPPRPGEFIPHCTLIFLDQALTPDQLGSIRILLKAYAHAPGVGQTFPVLGVKRFGPNHDVWAMPLENADRIRTMQYNLVSDLSRFIGIDLPASPWTYTPHVSLYKKFAGYTMLDQLPTALTFGPPCMMIDKVLT